MPFGHLCLPWRDICLSFWLTHFFDWIVCSFYWYWAPWAVCIFWRLINPLSIVSFADIFSCSVGCLFVLFMISFVVQKLLSLNRSHLFILNFIALEGESKRSCCGLCQRMTFLCLSLRVLLCHLTYRSLIHFESILRVMLGSVLISFFHIYLYSFPSTTYWRGSIFPFVYLCLLCHRCPQVPRLISGFSILFHWSIFLFLCQCHTILITALCSILWSQRAWLLQPRISFSRLHRLFWAVVFSYKL